MIRAILLALVLIALSVPARAGTFCVATVGSPSQCLYEDARACIKASSPPYSNCILNPDTPIAFWGTQRYCTVDSARTAECLYADRGQCNAAASQRRAICIDNAAKAEDIDPYLYDNRVQR